MKKLLIVLALLVCAGCAGQPKEEAPVPDAPVLDFTRRVSGDTVIETTLYRYTMEGLLSNVNTFDAEGICEKREVFTYEDDVLSCRAVYQDGGKSEEHRFSYDEAGRLSADTVTTMDGIVRREYLYDEVGRLAKERLYDGETYLGGVEYTYAGDELTMKEYLGAAAVIYLREEYDGDTTAFYDTDGTLLYRETGETDEHGTRLVTRFSPDGDELYHTVAAYGTVLELVG